jgi:hypothetical protein
VCATGDLGKYLVNAAADATQALSPPHKFIPWVTVDGEPLAEGAHPLLPVPQVVSPLSLSLSAGPRDLENLKFIA